MRILRFSSTSRLWWLWFTASVTAQHTTDAIVPDGLSLFSSRDSGAWPHGPFTTAGTWIQNAGGQNVTYAGVNWPGSLEVMIPEGLQYQSIQQIVSKIKHFGMNSIRLTYAIEMIDQVLSRNNVDVTIKEALTSVLGPENGTTVLKQILRNNPTFSENTTRLQTFGAVVSECAKQQVYVHLDNHVSKAQWCCNYTDGNAWWNDRYFSVSNWTRGLTYMANWAKSHNNVMSMSLRNELRPPFTNLTLLETSYDWDDWYKYTRQGADAIHAANPDVLVFLSGLNSDQELGPVTTAQPLPPTNTTSFRLDDFKGYADKIVLELHAYEMVIPVTDCGVFQQDLLKNGFQMFDGNSTKMPVLLTEWGFPQDGQTYNKTYAQCLVQFLPSRSSGWMVWTVGGSYYIREGKIDYDEDWGLLDHNWNNVRDEAWIRTGLKPLVAASYNQTNSSPQPATASGNSSHGTGLRDLLQSDGTGCLIAVWLCCVSWLLIG